MPVTTEVRVRYAETDQMGIVYYANYLVWFEIGRVELLRSLGLAYSQLETDHQCILPVVEATCRYRLAPDCSASAWYHSPAPIWLVGDPMSPRGWGPRLYETTGHVVRLAGEA